jgi:hypothetical protein
MSDTPGNIPIQDKPIYKKGDKWQHFPKPADFKPEATFPIDYPDNKRAGNNRCQAWAITQNHQCTALAMKGKHVCRKHGGKTPVGIESVHFKTGRYSTHLPPRMLSSYRASLNDPDLLSVRADIALLDSRLQDLLDRVDKGEAGHLWLEAWDAFRQLRRAMQGRDATQTLVAMEELEDKLSRGRADYAAWSEVLKVLRMREHAGQLEQKRLVDMNQTITIERALLLISNIGDVVRRNVTDRQTLLNISGEIAYLIDHPGEQGRQTEAAQVKTKESLTKAADDLAHGIEGDQVLDGKFQGT